MRSRGHPNLTSKKRPWDIDPGRPQNVRRTSFRGPSKHQKQLPEVFYPKRCSKKFHKIHRKSPVPESLF